jgi:hypothetical protein
MADMAEATECQRASCGPDRGRFGGWGGQVHDSTCKFARLRSLALFIPVTLRVGIKRPSQGGSASAAGPKPPVLRLSCAEL